MVFFCLLRFTDLVGFEDFVQGRIELCIRIDFNRKNIKLVRPYVRKSLRQNQQTPGFKLLEKSTISCTNFYMDTVF